ncbi:H-NS histone family protein [Paraburkholderia sp. Ac-20336]|uniref:H-NS histone family protein n=1 Tax=Burkholderiaceae TaxID=119060 RepID=UPI0014222501|nr:MULTISPECIES: H-NS histone family protein [Burkholderiaceae]MBN3804127.1 H-NS histone family protein [Paraburkholderia sp. Ac-20336]MBN3847073.1 H-NS histone family protein [Paraburkholderia sp. Ac-20342]NIF53191.1 H-NS histone family protein [Burkholderia sp. Ax-1724]NIF76756.1 H-NS histone family protein [Paraburkholderia sp. Cy-641]
MSSYKELLAQREKLEKQIEEAKSREYAEVLNEIKQKMVDYGISLSELGGGRAAKSVKAARPRAGVAPKYRDPESGNTWSGRGKPPRWIAGLDREKFLIEK